MYLGDFVLFAVDFNCWFDYVLAAEQAMDADTERFHLMYFEDLLEVKQNKKSHRCVCSLLLFYRQSLLLLRSQAKVQGHGDRYIQSLSLP